MPEYRRARLKGATVFITIVTFNRSPILINPKARQIFRHVWKVVTKKHPFTTDAFSLLPDHIHTMITLPQNDSNYSIRIREIKRLFTRNYHASVGEIAQRNRSHTQKNEATIWQRRFWEHIIRDEQDFQDHFDYIHYNPVKHGLVSDISAWPWSSFYRYVKLGVYESYWGDGYNPKKEDINFGE